MEPTSIKCHAERLASTAANNLLVTKLSALTARNMATAGLLFTIVALLWFTRRFGLRRKRYPGEPPIIPGLPFIGSGVDFQKDSIDLVQRNHARYGPVFTLQLPFNYLHLVADVHAVDAFVRNRDLNFDPIQRMVNKNVFGFRLHNANAIIRETAHSAKVGLLGRSMYDYANYLAESYESLCQFKPSLEVGQEMKDTQTTHFEWKSASLKELLVDTQFRAIFNAIFGRSDEHSFNYRSMRQNFETFHEAFLFLWLGFPLWMFPSAQEALNKMTASHPSASEFLKRPDASDYIHKALAKLLEAGATEREILGHNLVYLHVNYNTIKVTYWAMCRLIAHQEAMAALRDEAKAFLNERDRNKDGRIDVSISEVENLPVLDSVIRETFRVYSGVMMVREVTKNTELDLLDGRSYILRQGDKVAVYPPAIHNDPEIFEKPEIFRYDRFIGSTFYKEGRIVRNPLLPYGTKCPGQRLSMLQIKLFLLSFVACFDLEMEKGEQLPACDTKQYGQEILPPVTDVRIRVRQRKDQCDFLQISSD